MQTRDGIRFHALRNAAYHTARRRTFERLSKMLMFIVLLLGTAAAADLLAIVKIPVAWVGAAVATVSALQLVFDFAGQARTHQILQRDYFRLLSDVERTLDPSEEELALFEARMFEFAADEPPVMRAVDVRAYNDAAGHLDLAENELLHLPWWHRLLGGFVSFNGHRYKRLDELTS